MRMWALAAGLGLMAAVSPGSAGHASAGFSWGVTVTPKPDGSSGDVTINGMSFDYGTEPPAAVNVVPYARSWDPSVPAPACDAFLFRNGAQQDAQVVTNAHPWTVSLGGEIRWMVRVTCPSPQGATASPVEVVFASHAKPVPVVASTPTPSPTPAAVAPKPSASTPAPVSSTQHTAAPPQAPAGKVVSVAVPPAQPVASPAPSPSSPAVPAPVVVAAPAPSASPTPTPTPSPEPSPSPATPLVDAVSASTPAAALAVAPRAKSGGVPWVLLILVCVVVGVGGTLFIRSRGLR